MPFYTLIPNYNNFSKYPFFLLEEFVIFKYGYEKTNSYSLLTLLSTTVNVSHIFYVKPSMCKTVYGLVITRYDEKEIVLTLHENVMFKFPYSVVSRITNKVSKKKGKRIMKTILGL